MNNDLLEDKIIEKLILGELNIENLKKKLSKAQKLKEKYEKEIFKISRLIEYQDFLNLGFSKEEVLNFIKEDNLNILEAQKFIRKHNKLKNYMFGYPANLMADSVMVKYFKQQETELVIMNNCADTYEQGNYQMDSKEYERKILDRLFIHFGLKPPIKEGNGQYKGSWGYITSGGSESNRWGIENGLRKFQGGHVYYSKAAHYSVEKAVKLGFNYMGKTIEIPYTKIETEKNSEKIDTELLISEIKKNYKKDKAAAIVVLTWGTTKTGAIDDVLKIKKAIKDIPHYIHLDAALFGGISKNQLNAPKTPNIIKLGVDSLAISLHKYIGNSDVASAVISREKPQAKMIDYIGQEDSTTAGSRNINPFSMHQRVIEVLYRQNKNEYSKNIEKFENLLQNNNIKYAREHKSNIFVIDKPSDKICKKYQLSVFDDRNTKKAHIVIFPYHKEEIIKELIFDIKNKLK